MVPSADGVYAKMGCDGGSIPKRVELVKTKERAQLADKDSQAQAKWFSCAVSKEPLRIPVAACRLGRLYNKEAMINYFLDKSLYGDAQNICAHVKTLKVRATCFFFWVVMANRHLNRTSTL